MIRSIILSLKIREAFNYCTRFNIKHTSLHQSILSSTVLGGVAVDQGGGFNHFKQGDLRLVARVELPWRCCLSVERSEASL